MPTKNISCSILLIEDDLHVARVIIDFLEVHGHEVDYARDGKEGLGLARDHRFDVIILDGKLPRMDGLDVCRVLRGAERSTTPILMLSGRSELDDRLEGLNAGADDYLPKPFELRELGARVLALARRERKQVESALLRVGDLELDESMRLVRRAGKVLALGPIAFQVLSILMRQAPAVVGRPELERQIWGKDMPNSDSLRSHMYQLRQALDRDFERPMLQTLPTFGWRIATA